MFLILQNLTLGPEAKIEATMQHEITRLTSENLVKSRTPLPRNSCKTNEPTHLIS